MKASETMGNSLPDVTGRFLHEARLLLQEAGWDVASVTLTQAPGAGNEWSGGVFRVARQRLAGEGRVALTVVRQQPGKGSP